LLQAVSTATVEAADASAGAGSSTGSADATATASSPSATVFAHDAANIDSYASHAHALSEWATQSTDRAERALAYAEIAEIDERVRNDEVAAGKNYLAAFNSLPKLRISLDALIRIYLRRKTGNNLLKLADALLKSASTPRARAEALCFKAEILEDRINDSAGALKAYQDAQEADPTYRLSWMALERIARRTDDKPTAQRATLQLAELTIDPARKSRLLCELANDYAKEGTTESVDQASALFRAAAAQPKETWRALVELERFALKHSRPQDLAYALETRALLAQNPTQELLSDPAAGLSDVETATRCSAELWARAARVRAGVLDDPGTAQSNIEQALALVEQQPLQVRYVLDALAVADHAGDPVRSARYAQQLLDANAVDPSTRAGLLFRLAEAAAAEGDAAKAASYLRETITAVPDGAAAAAALFDQLVATGDSVGAVAELDRLAENEPQKKLKASLFRAGAAVTLALQGDVEGARRRLVLAAEADEKDTCARRAWLALNPKQLDETDANRALQYIDVLLANAAKFAVDHRADLLLRKLLIERLTLKQNGAATAEALARLGEQAWALPLAVSLYSAAGSYAVAAKLADELRESTSDEQQFDWTIAAARLHLAAGDPVQARKLFAELHTKHPSSAEVAIALVRLAIDAREPVAALDVMAQRAATIDDGDASRWFTVGAVLLAHAGATEESRKALEFAAERDPSSPAVRAALLATTRWRSDATLRSRLADATLDHPDAGDEETSLGVQLVLARLFLEHDKAGASSVLERVTARAGTDSLSVALLNAALMGSRHGPDANETVNALQAVLGAMPAADSLRSPVELEVARALSSSADTADQARDMRELLDDESHGSSAPRLLALLDAVQRDDRRDLSVALARTADGADEQTAIALRSAAITTLRGQGRDAEARTMALAQEGLAASAIALTELPVGLDHAGAKANAFRARAELAVADSVRADFRRRAAVWQSFANKPEDALAAALSLVKSDPKDLISWDVVRVCARRAKQWQRVVEACTTIAKSSKNPIQCAARWEEAGVTLFDQLERHRESEQPLRRAIELDPSREMAYKRLRIILEARKDYANLESLVTLRLSAEQSEQERVALLWEQARLRRAVGLREEALEAATAVVANDPEHVAALALLAEVHATSGRLDQAAEALVMLANAKETPVAQRRVARQGAIDIFEHRLKTPARAIELLERMVADGEANDSTIERGLTLSTKSGLWDAALRFSRVAAARSQTATDRCKVLLRMCEIQRDKLNDRAGALITAQTAHDVMPAELAALRAVHGLAEEDERLRRARKTIETLREWIRGDGPPGEAARRIALAAELGGDPALTRVALRAARGLGEDLPSVSAGTPAPKSSLRDPALALRFRDPQDAGVLASIVDTVLPDLAEYAGVSTDGANVGRSDRIRGASPHREAVAPYATALGITDFELYVGGNDDQRIMVIPGSTPALVLGKKLAFPFDENTRFRLARAWLLGARGVSAIDLLGVEGSVECILATMVAGDLQVNGGTSRFESRLKPVARAISRRARKATAELAKPVAASADPYGELAKGVRAVLSTTRRGALALSGAVGSAMQELMRNDPSDIARRDLLLYFVSDGLATVSKAMGVDRG
jgi:lipoprotein NlpI